MKTKLLFLIALITVSIEAQWTVQNTGFTTASRGIKSISIVDENIVWALGFDGSGLNANVQQYTKTVNGGTTWTPGTINISSTGSGIGMIQGLSDQVAYIVAFPNATGQAQGVYKTINGGTNWTKQTTATFTGADAFANVVHFFDVNNGMCMGDPNGGYFEIYTTTNGGTNWIRVPSANIPAPLSGEYGYTGQVVGVGDAVFFTTNMGRIYRSIDKGLNWTVYQSPISDFGGDAASGDISFRDANNGYLITSDQLFYKTTDGGQNWDLVLPDSSATSFFTSICAVPGSTAVMTTGSSTSLSGSSYTFDDGVNFTNVDTAVQHLDVKFLNPTVGWTGGFNTSATVGGISKWTGPALLSTIDVLNSKGFEAFPNPVVNSLTMRANENITNVEILNILGQSIMNVKPNSLTQIIDFSNLPSGTYIAKITIDNIEGSMKIVK